jgi:predicted nucleotidyltransferase
MNSKIPHSLHKKDLLLHYQKQKQKQQQLQDNALAEAKRLARILVEEFEVEAVYLFGPLSYEEFREGMNIDLAVEGVSSDTFASALGHLKQISTFGVELTDIHQADGWTKRSIVQKGKLLAEQKKTSTH